MEVGFLNTIFDNESMAGQCRTLGQGYKPFEYRACQGLNWQAILSGNKCEFGALINDVMQIGGGG